MKIRAGKSGLRASLVMPGLVPGISLREPVCPSNRDGRDKPGHDEKNRSILKTLSESLILLDAVFVVARLDRATQ